MTTDQDALGKAVGHMKDALMHVVAGASYAECSDTDPEAIADDVHGIIEFWTGRLEYLKRKEKKARKPNDLPNRVRMGGPPTDGP